MTWSSCPARARSQQGLEPAKIRQLAFGRLHLFAIVSISDDPQMRQSFQRKQFLHFGSRFSAGGVNRDALADHPLVHQPRD